MIGVVRSINPSTEEILKEIPIETKEHIEARVANAKRAFAVWKETTMQERSRIVKRLGRRLLSHKEKYAELMAKEMGKPVKEGLLEVEKCAFLCEYYGHNTKKFLKDDVVKTEYKKSYVTFEPLGIVLSIMPWNFPFWQPLRFAIPAIMTGNVVMLKHSSTVPQCSLAIEDAFKKTKFPENVFQSVIGDAATGAALAEADVNAISLTGSTEAGMRIAQTAAKGLKKFVLELGGNDPFIVLEDADIAKAVDGAAASRFLNCGQSCIAAKRLIVVKKVEKAFTDMLVEKVKKLKVGDPLQQDTDMGPMVNSLQRERLESQIKASVAQGAKILTGGRRYDRKGFFLEPTVLGSVTNNMSIAKEEAFGPVASIITAKDEDDAIKIANDTEYGLGASVWTENIEKGEKLAKKINAGVVSVNKGPRSDPRMPFGGAKKSGIGRELSKYGLYEMVNIKTVIVN